LKIIKESRICEHCGESVYYEASTSTVDRRPKTTRTYNDNNNKRVIHFKNWLTRIQGKERCGISPEDMDRVRELASIPAQIRPALRTLGLQRYYNHVYYIQRNLFGHALVELAKIHETRLLALFLRIQIPYLRIQKERTNMISYLYLIRKFCELLGYKELADQIPLLKCRKNLLIQDQLWKLICLDLGIPFYPSA
jgi:hypothetical protein